MARLKLPYLVHFFRKGRSYWYFRLKSYRTRLPGMPGEPGFLAAYEAALTAAKALETSTTADIIPGSIRALVTAYKQSPDWQALAEATKTDYLKALDPLAEKFGRLPVATMPRKFVLDLRDRFASKTVMAKDGTVTTVPTPRRANRMIAVLRLLLAWGIDRGWLNSNPAARPRMLRTGDGHRAWTEGELDAFLASDEVSAQIKSAAILAAASGLRSGDLVAATWSAWDGRGLRIKIGKNRADAWVPVISDGQREIERLSATRTAVTILTRPDGKPWQLSHFQHAASEAIRAAGLVGIVWHGLRATYSVRLSEAGATDAELQAARGDKTATQAAHYRRNADRKAGAERAVERINISSGNKSGS